MKKTIFLLFVILIFISNISSLETQNFNVLFYPDSDEIKSESYSNLQKILEVLKSNNEYLITLKGYTNSLGLPEEELELSKKRANKIALYLKDNGISLSKIKSEGFGSNNLKENKVSSINRRVEVFILKNEKEITFEEKTRKIKITILDNEGNKTTSTLTIKLRNYNTENVEHEENFIVKKPLVIDIPISKKIECLIDSDGYIPQKFFINPNEEEKIVYLQQIKKGEAFTMNCIYFDPNKTKIKKESLDIIDNVITMMNKNENIKLEVRGHTDINAPGNQKLSELRAKAVVDYMIHRGITSDRLSYKGFGGKMPIAEKTTNIGRSKNRRTEFFVLN